MEFRDPETGVSTVTVHWATVTGERVGQRSFNGELSSAIDRAHKYETKMLNLGFYTYLDDRREMSIYV